MKTIRFSQFALLATLFFGFSQFAFAQYFTTDVNVIGQRLDTYTYGCPHWYVGGNIGASRTHDRPNTGSGNSVDDWGPGWSVLGGYQLNSILGGEVGYTEYKNSREYAGNVMIAKTEHYTIHLAAAARYPVFYQWSALGKLGVAYGYAQKMAIAAGTSASASAVSVYWALGAAYSITPRVDFVAQFAEAIGNHLTGSTDLWSVGFNFAIV